jgi:hypothetical protein
MPKKRLPLALSALAIIILVGCKDPVGLPNGTVRAATTHTTYCTVAGDTTLTGYVSMWSGLMTVDSAHQTHFDKIRRGYSVRDGRWYPRMNGFCTFAVPHFADGTTPTPTCSLIYHQSAHSGSADLLVDWLYDIKTAPYDYDKVFWAAWDDQDSIITTDGAQSSDGWRRVPLTTWACNKIRDLGMAQFSSVLITGWVYTGSTDGTYADVSLADTIKVVYTGP